MANLETENSGAENEPQKFEKSGLPRNNSSFLNVDIGELEYSQSNKDLADAELHHILADAMSKPARRSRLSRGQLFEHGGRQSRTQGRYFPHRRRSSYGYRSFKHGNNQQNENGYRKSSDRSYKGRNTLMPPPPSVHLTVADDPSSEWNAAKTIPYLKQDDPNSTNSSVVDLSSSCGVNDDEYIYFAHPQEDETTQKSEAPANNERRELERQDSLQIDNMSNKTLTETVLPWKRNESSSSEEEPDGVRKQRDFPSWIRSKEYFSTDSPSDTMLYRIRRTSIPSMREIFPEEEDTNVTQRERRNSDTQTPTHSPPHSQQPYKRIPNFQSRDSCSRVDMEVVSAALRRQNSKAKDAVVIDFVPNGKAVTVRDSSLEQSDNRCEATRL